MKLKTEEGSGDDEIVIYCREKTDDIRKIELSIERILSEQGEIVATLGDTEYYISKKDILFFETYDGRIAVHTSENMYYTAGTLASLEATLPSSFVRASKSCIVNAAKVCAMSKNITGLGEILFRNTGKKTFVSRGYYKELKQKVYDTHKLEQ